jgi:hypothetical protein
MNRKWLAAGLGAIAIVAAGAIAIGQTINVPQVTVIGPTDLFQDIVGGAPQVGNVYASAPLLGNYSGTLPGNNAENALIAGDFGTNLFAYGTSVSTITTATTYVANRWFAWSGTSTTIAGAQETGAADIPAGYEASLRITRSGAGVLQSCIAQEVESINTYAFQGATAEFDFHALAGSGFSAASSNLQVYIITGTGTDQGSPSMAFGLNAQNTAASNQGQANAGWTGQVNLGPFLVPIQTVWQRYAVAAPIPAGATEMGVVICYKPVGASPSSDYFEFTGAQLTRNSALTSVAGASGAYVGMNDGRAKSFARRTQAMETVLQQRYYWAYTETASTDPEVGYCQAISAFYSRCILNNPVAMRTAPSPKATLGTLALQAPVGTGGLTALTAFASYAGSTNAVTAFLATVASGLTAGNVEILSGGNSTGGGLVGADAEL